jgi:hypothetical protein
MKKFNIAQINIALGQDQIESEPMQGFVERLDEINTLADQAPGFVWRLQTEDGDATSIQAFDNPLFIVNMSVWDSIECLKDFVYRSMHVELIRDRDAWFSKIPEMHQALWWVPQGHSPTIEEGKERLVHLRSHGATARAFTFAKSFSAQA